MNSRYYLVSFVSLCIGFGLGILSMQGSRSFVGHNEGDARLISQSRRDTSSSGSSQSSLSELNSSGFVKIDSKDGIKIGIASRWPRGEFNLIGSDGLVNRIALDEAGLTDDQYLEVQRIWDDFVNNVEGLVADNAVKNLLLSDDETGEIVYDIRPFADEGWASLESLEQHFSSQFGSESAKVLMSGVDFQNFGGFGKYETQVKFKPNTFDSIYPSHETRFVITVKDPKTGGMISETNTTSLKTLRKILGGAFVANHE
jgi:hypothetical protein